MCLVFLTSAFFIILCSLEFLAPLLQAICYKHQWYSYSAISSVCYGISDMSHGHNSTVFRVLFPKISTGQKKLAPTGWHGWHVFATLSRLSDKYIHQTSQQYETQQLGDLSNAPIWKASKVTLNFTWNYKDTMTSKTFIQLPQMWSIQ